MSQRERPQRVPTLLDQAVAKVGLLKAGKALGYLVAWAWASEKYGADLHPNDYAEHWLVSRATAYRHRALILDAFDGLDLEQLLRDVQAATKGERRSMGRAPRVGASIAGLPVEV